MRYLTPAGDAGEPGRAVRHLQDEAQLDHDVPVCHDVRLLHRVRERLPEADRRRVRRDPGGRAGRPGDGDGLGGVHLDRRRRGRPDPTPGRMAVGQAGRSPRDSLGYARHDRVHDRARATSCRSRSSRPDPTQYFFPFLGLFIVLFATTGIGNGSTFRMIGVIFKKDNRGPGSRLDVSDRGVRGVSDSEDLRDPDPGGHTAERPVRLRGILRDVPRSELVVLRQEERGDRVLIETTEVHHIPGRPSGRAGSTSSR